jgi:deoxyribonuclease (pyrimidine dimer)
LTRINLTKVESLTDQHLLTEYRELPRIFGNVRKAILAKKTWKKDYASKAPKDYVLGTGHMVFFYNKLLFLAKRQDDLIKECLVRCIGITFTEGLDYSDIPEEWLGDYSPTDATIALSQSRLDERIMDKPNWYKLNKVDITTLETQPCCTLLPNFKEV